MDIAKTAAGVLLDAEHRLRGLVGAAAEAGEYENAARIMEWAREVGGMVRATETDIVAHGAGVAAAVDPSDKRRAARTVGDRRAAAGAPKFTYPRFLRRQNTLIKVGWSKRERAEYEHKSPKHVALLLAGAFARASKNGNVLSTDRLLPLVDHADGSEIPMYQAYVCLAWLREAGLVEARGRQGYLCKNAGALESDVEALWNRTPIG